MRRGHLNTHTTRPPSRVTIPSDNQRGAGVYGRRRADRERLQPDEHFELQNNASVSGTAAHDPGRRSHSPLHTVSTIPPRNFRRYVQHLPAGSSLPARRQQPAGARRSGAPNPGTDHVAEPVPAGTLLFQKQGLTMAQVRHSEAARASAASRAGTHSRMLSKVALGVFAQYDWRLKPELHAQREVRLQPPGSSLRETRPRLPATHPRVGSRPRC